MIWISDISEDNFYPKCFDLNDEDDNVGFEMHFKICKALSIVKIYTNFKSNPIEQKNGAVVEDLKLRT